MSSNTDIEELRKEVIDICEKHRITESLNFTGINFEDEIAKFIQQKVIEAQQSLISEYQRVLSIKQDGAQISLYEFGQIMNIDKKRMWHELAQLNHNKKGDSNE